MSKKNGPQIHETQSNIFADLGLDDADELHAKSELVFRIPEIIRRLKLTQAKEAVFMRLKQILPA